MVNLTRHILASDLISSQLSSKKSWAFSCLVDGLPGGALWEFSGPSGGGKTEIVLKFLSEHPEQRVAWVEESLTVYPCAFVQQKVALQRVLFVETSRYLWAVQQILRSQIFAFVILSAPVQSEVERRRLQIAAEKASASVILITEDATRQASWPISVQLQVSRCQVSGEARLEVIKFRGARRWENLLPIANGI
jgi:hypothetical protein